MGAADHHGPVPVLERTGHDLARGGRGIVNEYHHGFFGIGTGAPGAPEFAIFGGIFLFYKDFTENESLVDEVSYRVDDLHRKESHADVKRPNMSIKPMLNIREGSGDGRYTLVILKIRIPFRNIRK